MSFQNSPMTNGWLVPVSAASAPDPKTCPTANGCYRTRAPTPIHRLTETRLVGAPISVLAGKRAGGIPNGACCVELQEVDPMAIRTIGLSGFARQGPSALCSPATSPGLTSPGSAALTASRAVWNSPTRSPVVSRRRT